MKKDDEELIPAVKGTGLVHSHPVTILFDTGATHSFMSESYAKKLGVRTTIGRPYVIRMPDGNQVRGNLEVRECPIMVSDQEWPITMLVTPLQEEDVILGLDWMWKYYALIDVRGQVITVGNSDGKRHEIKVRRIVGPHLSLQCL